MSRELHALTDDELRARLRGYAYDEPHLDELCRRIPAIGTLRIALHAAASADTEESETSALAMDLDIPDSPGTRAVRDLYTQALTDWMDGATQLVTQNQAAVILAMDDADSAARTLARWQVYPVGYTGGPRPEALYARQAVDDLVDTRPTQPLVD
jgi:hypothetical protein